MQARTARTSGRGLGTAFSAAAAKERGTATVEARINQKGSFKFKFVLGFDRLIGYKYRPEKRVQFSIEFFSCLKTLFMATFFFTAGDLEVLIAGKPFNISTITTTGTNIPDGNITLVRDSNGSITALFPSNIAFTFTDVEGTLAIAFEAPDDFKNRTKGLLGTWNDNPLDDFVTPDGTLVPADASPRRIHHEFGLKCEFLLLLL